MRRSVSMSADRETLILMPQPNMPLRVAVWLYSGAPGRQQKRCKSMF